MASLFREQSQHKLLYIRFAGLIVAMENRMYNHPYTENVGLVYSMVSVGNIIVKSFCHIFLCFQDNMYLPNVKLSIEYMYMFFPSI